MKKIVDLLNELEELVESGNSIPFSSKAMVDPVIFMEILDEIREELPQEIQDARKIVAERKQILFEAKAEAERICAEADSKTKRMIDENDLMIEARRQAEAMVLSAQKQAKEIRLGTQHYADKLLYNCQVKLKELNDTIEQNRRELKEIDS